MGPLDLYFDVRDIFRAPRLALSGKKIWIFMITAMRLSSELIIINQKNYRI